MELGARIAAWLRWKDWTQAQLADATGLSRAAICAFIGAGKKAKPTSPSQASLDAIIEALGLTILKFYGPIPAPKKKPATKRAVA